jgi:uncharacterized protein YuzE
MAENLTFSYAPSSDEMNIHLGEPRPAIAREIDDEVYLRIDPETREVVGLTVLHFRARFGQAKAQPFSLVLPALARLELSEKAVEALAG